MGATSSIENDSKISFEQAKEIGKEKMTEKEESEWKSKDVDNTGLTVSEIKELYPNFFLKKNHFLVSVDGSENAHISYELGIQLRDRINNDCSVEVLHVESTKDDLPDYYKAPQIKIKYESAMTEIPNDCNSGYTPLNKEDKDTHTILLNYINKHSHPNKYLICGITGRKHAEGSSSVFGTNAGYAIRALHCPVIIGRKLIEDNKAKEGLHFLIAVDSSSRSKLGIKYVHNLLISTDKITFLHIYDEKYQDDLNQTSSTQREDLEKDYKSVVEEYSNYCHSATWVAIPKGEEKISTIIQNYNLENDVDFCCLTIEPRNHVGSIGEAVASKGKANLIIIKSDLKTPTTDKVEVKTQAQAEAQPVDTTETPTEETPPKA